MKQYDNYSDDFASFTYPAETDQEILVEGIFNGMPFDVEITYSVSAFENEGGGCSVSCDGTSSPPTPFSVLAAFTIVAAMGYRRQNQHSGRRMPGGRV